MDSIHCLYDLDVKGYCTHNKLGGIICIIISIVYGHVWWFCSELLSDTNGRNDPFLKNILDQEANSSHWPPLLLLAIYPLVCAWLGLSTLMVNMCCFSTNENGFVFSW